MMMESILTVSHWLNLSQCNTFWRGKGIPASTRLRSQSHLAIEIPIDPLGYCVHLQHFTPAGFFYCYVRIPELKWLLWVQLGFFSKGSYWILSFLPICGKVLLENQDAMILSTSPCHVNNEQTNTSGFCSSSWKQNGSFLKRNPIRVLSSEGSQATNYQGQKLCDFAMQVGPRAKRSASGSMSPKQNRSLSSKSRRALMLSTRWLL